MNYKLMRLLNLNTDYHSAAGPQPKRFNAENAKVAEDRGVRKGRPELTNISHLLSGVIPTNGRNLSLGMLRFEG